MKVLSLFSGVGGFDLGLENAGMKTVAMCEWDKKAASVLRRHWPHIPIYGDVSDLTGAQLVADGVMPDLVAFGSPCQDLSVAGKRAGLSGERSGLFHEAIRIIRELRELSDGTLPRWVIWENVVGALNSNGGQDFQAVLDQMADLGACFSEWGVMDAQNYGVAQRRRRIFLVACLDPRTAQQCPDPLLPLGQGRPRDLEPIREAWKGSPRGLEERSPRHHRREFIFQPGGVVRLGGHFAEDGVVPTLRAEAKRGDMEPHVLIAGIDDRRGGFRFDNGGESRATVLIPYTDIVGTLTASDGVKGHTNNQSVSSAMLQVYGIAGNIINRQDHNGGNGPGFTSEGGPMYTLTTLDIHAVATTYAVRRLTPLECERLMGWPDNWTRYDAEGKEQTDGHRYKQCGNGIASPVAEWVGRQIFATDALRNL